MPFTFHDNNQNHESLDDWIRRTKMVDNNFFDQHIQVTTIGAAKATK